MALILGALCAFGPLSIDMYLPSLPEIANQLHTGTSLVQVSLTACLLGLALGQLIAGSLSDTHGRLAPLKIALIVYAVASFLCAFTPSIELLIAFRFIQGVAGAAGVVISRAIVRDLYSGVEMTKFFTLLMLVNGLAPIFAPMLGGALLIVTSWRGVFVVLGLFGILMLTVVATSLPETLPQERRSAGGVREIRSTFSRLLKDRTFMGYTLVQGCAMAAVFGYISGSPFVMQEIFGVSPQVFSLLFGVNGLGLIIVSQITGRLAGQIPERTLLVSGLYCALFGGFGLLVTVLAGGGIFLVALCLFFVVASIGFINPTAFSLAMQEQGQSAGSAAALLGMFTFITGAVSAPLVGLGGSGTAVPMGVVIAVAEAGAVLSYLLLIRREEKVS